MIISKHDISTYRLGTYCQDSTEMLEKLVECQQVFFWNIYFHCIIGYGGHSMTTWTQFCILLPPPSSTFTMNVDKNKHFGTTYLPLLVHVVIEQFEHPYAACRKKAQSTCHTGFLEANLYSPFTRVSQKSQQFFAIIL